MAKKDSSYIALVVFFILTSIIICIEYYTKYITGKNYEKYFLYGYIGLIIIAEWIVNIKISEDICGESQMLNATYATLLTWCIVFPAFVVLLYIFPGWLAPFANTFGKVAEKIFSSTIEQLFPFNIDESLKEQGDSIKKLHYLISKDSSILLKQITPYNFDTFWSNFKPNFKQDIELDTLESNFKQMVGIKFAISKLIWYSLVGVLTSYMSYNFIINSTCKMKHSIVKKYNKELEKEQLNDN
jgi:hypothetical protein